ncbi:taperin isoform X2 [Dermochelys coriacea]|uniref:taperin isoform X2 n=1 Tax=Dermochelys coriacea TaxID=27794 RepID=UPI001CA84934|nr:taperin isoform X2 [Dermochelys coriacea]
MEPPLSAAGGPALPLWKREILERKRAKLAGPPAGGGEPGGGGRAGPAPPEERLVLADSLGPLRENPFMRLESERRRLRQGLPGGGRRGAGRPLQELLELYSAVPGIRTIRADNILIIESQPDADAGCFAAGEGARDPLPAASPRGRDPLRDLLARKGSALTEIRAAQVFVYEPTESGQAGRVSRLLQKFDQRPRGRRRRSRDAEPGPLVAVPNSPVSPPARPAPVPGSPVSTAAPQRVPVPVASPPNRRVPGSSVSAAVPRPLPAPGSPVSPTAPRPVPVLPASPPNRRAPGSPVSPTAPRPVPGSPVSPTAPRPVPVLPASPPNRRAPGSPVSPAAPGPLPVSGSPDSPPNRRAPGSPVSPAAPGPLPVSGSPDSPPNRRAPGSPVSPAAPGPLPVSVSPVSPVAPQPVPGSPGTSQACGFLHKIGSNSFIVSPRGLRPGSRAPLTNSPLEQPSRSPCAKAPPVPSPSVSLARDNTRPKPERSKEIQPSQSSATPSPLQPLSASVLRDGGSFEIRPAPKPDLATIPAHDFQAKALANLRLNSRNSFLFVPCRGRGQCLTESAGALSPLKPECEQQGEPITPPQAPQELLVPVTYIDDDIVELDAGGLPQEMGPAAGLKDSEQPQEATSDLGMETSAIPLYIPHSAASTFQQRGGNTFTIVPKRKPPSSGLEVDSGASKAQQSEEEDDEESRSKGKTLGSPGASQLDLGPLLKKRYPTVNEIEVIGGYLSLERSCMSKMGSHRKKMKISFNETSLQTTFEYPSESSLVEEEESSSEVEDDEEDKPSSLFIPRPTCTMHANVPSSGFSSYTPKHSVEFSKWQEQEYEEQPATAAGPLLKEANPTGNQVMLTPADQSGLSDFSSEPALYF